MAVIDLSTGSGLRSSGVPVPAARRLITAGLPVMTPTPAVTPASVSAALQPEFAAMQALLASVPVEVWAHTVRTLTGGIPSSSDIATAVISRSLTGGLPTDSLGQMVKETTARVVSNL